MIKDLKELQIDDEETLAVSLDDGDIVESQHVGQKPTQNFDYNLPRKGKKNDPNSEGNSIYKENE